MKAIRIIVVSPSAVERSRISRAFSDRVAIDLVAVAGDLHEAFTVIEATEPDVVIFAEVFCNRPDFDGMLDLVAAINARWISLHGPGACCPRDQGTTATRVQAAPAHAVQCLEDLLQRIDTFGVRPPTTRRGHRPALASTEPLSDRVVVIGASTGGIDALLTVLADFPANCPPTAIVQHTGHGFSQSLVRLFDKRCAARVVVAEDGLILAPGMVCVAGGMTGHLRLHSAERLVCSVREGPEVSGQIPSVDVLFRSALPFADRTIAALLTGMGSDGAAGLLDLCRAGSFTIGQDEATSVVYGMPRVAHQLGAVRQQLPISRIGAAIMQLASNGQPAQET
jgi:two-component system, chemotaxis family, protein-glutamate methylesterase/glutaminase